MLEFRKAKEIEAMDVHQLVQQTIRNVYPKYYPVEIVTFFSEIHNEKRVLQDISNGNLWVLLDGTRLLGTCTCLENMIIRLFVKSEFQCQGFGRMILDYIEEVIFQTYDQIILEAVISASRMYEKRGYKVLNHEKLIISESAILVYEVMKLDRTGKI